MNHPKAKSTALRLIRWHASRRSSATTRLISKVAEYYRQCYRGPPYEIDANGEARVISKVSELGGKTYFDVGANVGEWALRTLGVAPADAAVHCFEIAPPTYTKLQSVLGNDPRVRLNPFGLADRVGAIDIEYYPSDDTVTTAVRGMQIHGDKPEVIAARAITGDQYCEDNEINQIDMLKIDTEGAEPAVIRGFEGMLAKGAVGCMQFEYGLANIYTRFLLLDYYEYLRQRDFVIGKVYLDGVYFKDYHPYDEDFIGPNYVAVHNSRPDLIQGLGVR